MRLAKKSLQDLSRFDLDLGLRAELRLSNAIAQTGVPLVFVGPDIGELIARFRDEAPQVRIVGLEARWNALAEAIIVSATRRFHKSCNLDRLCSRCVAYFYGATLDSQDRLRYLNAGQL